jgi:hypothetical protein
VTLGVDGTEDIRLGRGQRQQHQHGDCDGTAHGLGLCSALVYLSILYDRGAVGYQSPIEPSLKSVRCVN